MGAPTVGTRPDYAPSCRYQMLTIGETPYISTLPLYLTLRRRVSDQYKLVPGRLSELSAAFSRGELDVGPITLVEYLSKPDQYAVVPRLSLSSLGRSGCMLLCSRRPAYELADARIAVPPTGPSAVALLRWLMREMYRFEPTLVERTGGLAESLAEHDAVLLYQDQALQAGSGTSELYQIWDLGEAWWQITNTPLVYMLWAARYSLSDEEIDDIGTLFGEAKAAFPAERKVIVEEAQRRTGLPAPILEGYLGRFNYDCTPAHMEGIEFFRQTVATLAPA